MTVELESLAELEPALAADGFFGRDDVVAHVYVGYRCSDTLRRTDTPAPPEPCPLPAVAYAIEPLAAPRRPPANSRSASGGSTLDRGGVRGRSRRRARCDRRGRRLPGEPRAAPVRGLRRRPAGARGALAPLRPLAPAPLAGDGWAIVSASPELLLSRRGRRIRTSPIKGTRPAGVPSSRRRTQPST